MDFQSAMETFAEAWVAANTKTTLADVGCSQSQAIALTRGCKTPPTPPGAAVRAPGAQTPPPEAAPKPETLMAAAPKEEYDMSSSAPGYAPGRSLPVHCVVEAVSSMAADTKWGWRRRPVVETDSYVIIPANTAFQDVVAVALSRLGYSTDSVDAAKGSVVIKNWKPLNFDKITDGSQATVEDILGELTTVATLRIQLYRARPSVLSDIKDKLLRLLLLQSHSLLVSTGCPLDEVTLSQLCRTTSGGPGHHSPEPSEECRRKFEQWWTLQVTQQAHNPRPPAAPQYSPGSGHHHQHSSPGKPLDRPPSLPAAVHPALQTLQSQYPTQKTRMRTSFDPELELPKLQRWFAENQHPSRQQIQQYVKELNGLESRRGRKPLDVNNVVYWFKNARAAQKRAELRGVGAGALAYNGYHGGHSPPAPPQDNKSPGSPRGALLLSDNSGAASEQDMDEDEDEDAAASPAPLALTTSDKDAASPHVQTDSIKQEPPDDIPSPLSTTTTSNNNTTTTTNNNNNNNNKEYDEGSDMEEEEEEDELEDIEERRKEDPDISGVRPQERLRPYRSPSPSELVVARGGGPHNLGPGFPLVPNSMFSHSIMYMSHYIPGLAHGITPATSPSSSSGGLNLSAALAASADERRKRNRTFIDPVTEVPRLEQWFSINTHPSHTLILKYTEDLNRMPYRQKFPRLEPKNVQFWFKNRRAKCKRLKMSLFDNGPPTAIVNHQQPPVTAPPPPQQQQQQQSHAYHHHHHQSPGARE